MGEHQIDFAVPPAVEEWLRLAPPFASGGPGHACFRDFARRAAAARSASLGTDRCEAVDEALDDVDEACAAGQWPDHAFVSAACQVLGDLTKQGWAVRVDGEDVWVAPPTDVSADAVASKARVRQQELVKRDVQLRQSSVREFVQRMERRREHHGKFVSIFSLMRDGRELAGKLSAGLAESAVDPYLQVVDDSKCEHTGLRLVDIWRYFRHGWTNQYVSTPGRTMMFLVRDRAAAMHPVMGIAALASPIVQVRERDSWIGWHPAELVETMSAAPSDRFAEWLSRVLDEAVAALYLQDLIEEELITPRTLRSPDAETIQRLRADSAAKREEHHRLAHRKEHKGREARNLTWEQRARQLLFRSKRSGTLAELLEARSVLAKHFITGSNAECLARLLADPAGKQVAIRLIRKAKGDRVGVLMADISVCGAVQPYNALTTGKLVAMLAASPQVVAAYKQRYANATSEIASAMAGRPIVKTPLLAFLATTSLYGTGSSQYNRIRVPGEVLGGSASTDLRFVDVGHSKAYGTSQFSDATVRALGVLVGQVKGGQRVNSVFGEGHSPRLRKVRDGLDALKVPTDHLLHHGRPRVIYCVSLVTNLRDFLLGIDEMPNYIFPLGDEVETTTRIARWWMNRWAKQRARSPAVIDAIRTHTLVYPVAHGGRVPLPEAPNAQPELDLGS